MTEALATLLCTAYAMEKKSLAVIREHLLATDNPEVGARIRAHFVETQWQIKLLRACLEIQGIDEEALDAESRNCISEIESTNLLTIKRFEINIYKTVIAEARKQHMPEILQCCREILEQERAMAECIEDNYFTENLSFPKKTWASAAA